MGMRLQQSYVEYSLCIFFFQLENTALVPHIQSQDYVMLLELNLSIIYYLIFMNIEIFVYLSTHRCVFIYLNFCKKANILAFLVFKLWYSINRKQPINQMSLHNLSSCLSLRMRKTSPFAAACPKFYKRSNKINLL